MAQKSIGICLLGCGTIGGGVVKIFTQDAQLLEKRTGIRFELRHVVDTDPSRNAEITRGLPRSTDAAVAIDDPATDIIIELIGGTGVADKFIQQALRKGKAVVTANKSLLSLRGPELFALARAHNTCIAFEASCGGGIPIIHALVRGLAANRVDALVGIVNGTCNVILTRMTRNAWTYEQALAEAQKAGFAEADPTLDVSGKDTAQKLGILASLAFNVRVNAAEIQTQGIDKLDSADIKFAGDLGYVIKLLAIAQRAGGDKVSLRVHPTLVHQDDVLAEVSGPFNAISVWGHALGHALFYGRGAGQMPTASAIVSDCISIALGSWPIEFKQMNIFPDATPPADLLPQDQWQSRYYLRLMAKDQPGVLAQVTQALGKNGIGLAAIHQRENNDGKFVPVVITTHLAKEGAVRAALTEIDALPIVLGSTVCLRILDAPAEFGA